MPRFAEGAYRFVFNHAQNHEEGNKYIHTKMASWRIEWKASLTSG